MIELIDDENVWDKLKSDGKPVIIYGMGNAADRIIDLLQEREIAVSDIFASDEFVRGHSFRGMRVKKYSEICREYSDFNVVLAFASHLEDVLRNIKRINSEHTVYAPDIPVAGSGLFTREFVKEHDKEFDFIYNRLADEESRRVYLDIIRYKISGKVDYLYTSFCNKGSIYSDILKLKDDEFIVDMGAYDGDTICEFTAYTKGKYKEIIAMEPDAKNFRKLSRNTEGMQGVRLYNMAAWNRREKLTFADTSARSAHIAKGGKEVEGCDLDSLINNENVTLIKMDIEGCEKAALSGAEKTIRRCRPKLYVCAYHRNEDLFDLPMKILEIDESYKLYFRHSVYVPAWESNFYCV